MQQFNSLASPETRSDEVEAARRFQFAIHHVGINCGDPETGLETARVLCALFGLTPRTLPGISTFADPFIECMHKIGRGAMGHICVTTTDVDGAMAHLASKGHPLLGDYKYGDAGWNRQFQERYQVRAQQLHAYQMKLPWMEAPLDEISGMTFTAKVPPLFWRLIKETTWEHGIQEALEVQH